MTAKADLKKSMATQMAVSLCMFIVCFICFLASLYILFLHVSHFQDMTSVESFKRWNRSPSEPEILSWRPRVFLYHNFLSKNECDHLIGLATPNLQISYVVNPVSGQKEKSSARTSQTAVLQVGQDEVVESIERRIASLTFIPEENGESIQITHYGVDEKYGLHYDYFFEDVSLRNGGQRMATFLMYLADVKKGGQTVFPLAEMSRRDIALNRESSYCLIDKLSVKPKAGDALLFWNIGNDGAPDSQSLHGSCPVIEGEKWVATKWLRVNGVQFQQLF